MATPDRNQVLEALRSVHDPELGRDIVSLDMVKDITIQGGEISVEVELTTPACPLKAEIERSVESALSRLEGVSRVKVDLTANVPSSAGETQATSGMNQGVKNFIAIASGKGGVGKSTVSVNLACALARAGARVGLMDADILGPNVPLMMGVEHAPPAQGQRLEPAVAHGVKVMSMGFLVRPDEPVIWRGPMLHNAVQQFINNVAWGDLDYLLIDLPPGTGDVQLSLSQNIPLTGALVVTTPQAVALLDVRKAVAMFRKVNVPLLGVVENMSSFVCPHCHEASDVFSHGGGREAATTWDMPFLGEVPLVPSVREGGDRGVPIVMGEPEAAVSHAFRDVAEQLAARVSVQNLSDHPALVIEAG